MTDDSLKEQTPYTPSMDDLREWWAEDQNRTHGMGDEAHLAEFDRWLAAHEQKVREEAWEEGKESEAEAHFQDGGYGNVQHPANPYTPKETPDE